MISSLSADWAEMKKKVFAVFLVPYFASRCMPLPHENEILGDRTCTISFFQCYTDGIGRDHHTTRYQSTFTVSRVTFTCINNLPIFHRGTMKEHIINGICNKHSDSILVNLDFQYAHPSSYPVSGKESRLYSSSFVYLCSQGRAVCMSRPERIQFAPILRAPQARDWKPLKSL